MKVVNKEVWFNTLCDAVKANFALSDPLNLKSVEYLEESPRTAISFIVDCSREVLGDLDTREFVSPRLGLSEVFYNRDKRFMSDLKGRKIRLISKNKHVITSRYGVVKKQLIINYFKHKGISYEKFS
jgi:hypothetical protein